MGVRYLGLNRQLSGLGACSCSLPLQLWAGLAPQVHRADVASSVPVPAVGVLEVVWVLMRLVFLSRQIGNWLSVNP
jgi:hypothetical protein